MAIDWEFDLHFDQVRARVNAVLPAAMAKAMEHVRGVAAELTPVDTGHLVGSAEVTVTAGVGDLGTPIAELYYPGPYARNQHYSLDFQHTKGQALYLEQPMITEAARVVQIIADEIGDVL